MHAVSGVANKALLAAKKAEGMYAAHACRKPARPPTADPFTRLLALVTPLTTETGLYTPGPLHKVDARGLSPAANACITQGHSNSTSTSSCESTPITVNSLCGYLCKRGMHAAADEFLAAVCRAAEDSRMFGTLPILPTHLTTTQIDPTNSEGSSVSSSSGETVTTTRGKTRVGWQVDQVAEYEVCPQGYNRDGGMEEEEEVGGACESSLQPSDMHGASRSCFPSRSVRGTSFCAGAVIILLACYFSILWPSYVRLNRTAALDIQIPICIDAQDTGS